MRKRWMKSLIGAAGLCVLAGTSNASLIINGSGTAAGNAVSAQAIFDISGNDLTITLINNSGSIPGQDAPGSTLSGLFWDLTGSPTLTPFSATVPVGSSIVGDPCNIVSCVGVTDVAGEFGYQATALPGGADRGISSSGYLTTGLFGNIGNFNNGAAGTDLDFPDSLDGINFGIISAAVGFDPNGGLANDPLIKDRVTFVLKGVSGLSLSDISHVSFQYGTSLTETNIPGDGGGGGGGSIPEPATVLLFGASLLAMAAMRRRAGAPR